MDRVESCRRSSSAANHPPRPVQGCCAGRRLVQRLRLV
jgi:hypothetical protein